ncbi:MAG: hypothetical protein HC835_10745 [Oscillatoriales cyanobacterium RM2_1_1]|nr:hypothetical protein [Oscillatoriales cyanobacterium SM2_3_0]NJO46058.1 hypothetical protein [Oscillatoriales cyanobacterium RM2_1_1]
MLWSNKKLTQPVTFTEDAADQTLLEAIEQELVLTKYQTFSNLCKQALWQFLSISDPSPQSAPRNIDGLEGQMYQLQQQLTELEKNVLAEESNRFNQLQQQLIQLTQQLSQLQNVVASRPISSHSPIQVPSEPAHRAEETSTSIEHSDPVLARLSALVDDF